MDVSDMGTDGDHEKESSKPAEDSDVEEKADDGGLSTEKSKVSDSDDIVMDVSNLADEEQEEEKKDKPSEDEAASGPTSPPVIDIVDIDTVDLEDKEDDKEDNNKDDKEENKEEEEVPSKKAKISDSDGIVVMDVSDMASDDGQEKDDKPGEDGVISRPNSPAVIDIVDIDDKDDDDAELPQKKSKICNSDEIVVMDVSDLANDDDQEKPKEGTTSRPTTPSPIDIVQVEDSDEDEGVGAIRIRDFGSIKEISEDEDDDDDVVEIPQIKIHTNRVKMEDEPEYADLDMDCVEEGGITTTVRPRNDAQTLLQAKRRILALKNYIKEAGGLKVKKPMVETISHDLSNLRGRGLNNLFARGVRGFTPITRPNFMTTGNNTYRLSNSRTPISIVRSRPINTTMNGAQKGTIINSNGKEINIVSVDSIPSLTQLIFDPATGLLLCPSPGGGNTMQAIRPTSQTLQTIQSASQMARYNTPASRMPNASQTTTQLNYTGSASNMTNFIIDPTRPLGALRQMSSPGMTFPVSRTPTPTASSMLINSRLSGGYNNTTTTNPRSTNSNIRVVTAQQIAELRKKGPRSIAPIPGPQSYLRPAVAPTASSTVKLLNQQKAAAIAAASAAKHPVVEEVTAGSLQAISAPDKDPHNSKTFPSLVVMVKPCLQEKLNKQQLAASRSDLDLKVKTILMYTPSKFTEWLMQKGLLSVDHKCTIHPNSAPYKLGMYSDGASKQPFSGGYVWISDCCSDKQVSVFQGSIFEASVYPPGTLMKLIYHWSCQTPASNVLQWVKVTSYYLKNFYTLLRSTCVAGLHENCPIMGGAGKYIEIGIITLGTTVASAVGQQKQVKIEILGVFDPASKSIRMKVINPQNVGVSDINNERISQILWPLNHWVDKKSVVLIDTSMDKTLLEEMGFAAVSQSKGTVQNQAQKSTTPTNVNVMNYLKNVVPKMFQNTLCVLSKSLIQQFLDELSWREIWGANPTTAFDTIINHLVQMTKADTGESLISRLNKISLNPFTEWSINPKSPSGIECLPESIRGGPSLSLMGMSNSDSDFTSIDRLGEIAANYMSGKTASHAAGSSSASKQVASYNGSLKRKADVIPPANNTAELTKYLMKDHQLRTVILQMYYYIWCSPNKVMNSRITRGNFPQNIKCPLCSKLFVSNIDCMKHVIVHVVNVGRSSLTQAVCNYCLKEVSPASSLPTHINESHKLVDIPFCCRICNEKFASETSLTLHMWQHHAESEAPYHCEICEYRSSYHYEVVDHFYKHHAGLDCVQCPICLKVINTRSFGCLKILVVHLQNHMIKKGKKCLDCCLLFVSDSDYRAHIVADKAHESRAKQDFNHHEILGDPIAMAKPPPIHRVKLPAVPAKKPKISQKDGPTVTTLNSELVIPINPNEKFTADWFPIKIRGLDKNQYKCWECEQPFDSTDHLSGIMKCTKCKYQTNCAAAMAKHTKLHIPGAAIKAGPQKPKPKSDEEDLSCGCGFRSRYSDKIAFHLLMCEHKVATPFKEAESREDDDVPPVLHEQLPLS